MVIEFKSYLEYESLKSIFEKYIHSNSALGLDNIKPTIFKDNIMGNFNIIQRKVADNTYKFTPYKEKLLLKNRNSTPRLISIPTIRDKVVLKALDLYLKDIFIEINQPLPQTIIKNIKSSINRFDSYIKLDVSQFYNTISHGLLIKMLENFNGDGIDKNALDLIKKAITTPTKNFGEKLDSDFNVLGIPQGISISNVLASIFLLNFDEKFSDRNNFIYIRYVDDILILCNSEDLKAIQKEIVYEIEGIYNLKLNEKKTKYGKLELGFDFLGYFIYKNSEKFIFSVKDENKKKFEDSLVKIFSKKKHSPMLSNEQFIFLINHKITGSISSNVTGNLERDFNYGWLFYYSQINDTKYLYELDWLVRHLLRKFSIIGVNNNEIKSFVKTFYEIKYNYESTGYIFRPDIYTALERKDILMNIFKVPESDLNNNNQIRKWYYKLVYRPILEYEKDIKTLTY